MNLISTLIRIIGDDIRFGKDHGEAKGKFEQNYGSIESIVIENNCLLSIENRSNIIQVKLNGAERDFRKLRIGP